jgi:hypothetical protein
MLIRSPAGVGNSGYHKGTIFFSRNQRRSRGLQLIIEPMKLGAYPGEKVREFSYFPFCKKIQGQHRNGFGFIVMATPTGATASLPGYPRVQTRNPENEQCIPSGDLCLCQSGV